MYKRQLIAYIIFYSGRLNIDGLVSSTLGRRLGQFWLSGWGIDWFYDRLFVKPYYGLANVLKSEPIDAIYGLIVAINQTFNHWLSVAQSGRMRWYLASMVAGLILVITVAANLSVGVL